MKEVVIISGKGGTGKTSLTASFAYLARNHAIADCDVDAADLHILAQPRKHHSEEFYGGVVAAIDPGKCTGCGLCREHCRYEAISEDFAVDRLACEGCGVCYHVCPEGAVELQRSLNGEWYISESRFGPMVHAALYPGEENSGKLVALVRNQAKVLAKQQAKSLVLVDGAPGVGCPVISSVTGADHVVIVTEPTLSGLHDLKRAVELVHGFDIPMSVVINKADINADVVRSIRDFCDQAGLPVIGEIPYDPAVTAAMVRRRAVVEENGSAVGNSIRAIWKEIERAVLS